MSKEKINQKLLEGLIFFVKSACFECPKEIDDNSNEIVDCKDCNIVKYKNLIADANCGDNKNE